MFELLNYLLICPSNVILNGSAIHNEVSYPCKYFLITSEMTKML